MEWLLALAALVALPLLARGKSVGVGTKGAFVSSVGVLADRARWCLVPKCVANNPTVGDVQVFPKNYWSTFIAGSWPSMAVATWLREWGVDPVSLIKLCPQWQLGHLSGGDHFDLKRHFSLSNDLLDHLGEVPGLAAALAQVAPQLALVGADFSTAGKSYEQLNQMAQTLRLAIEGSALGLTVWPPCKFYSQAHLDAWLAHHQLWRYGFDSATKGWGSHVSADAIGDPPDSAEYGPRFLGTSFEGIPPGNPTARAFDAGPDQWPRALTEEEFHLPMGIGMVRAVPQWKLSIGDEGLQSKLGVLYGLTCVQLAAYTGRQRRLPDAFPGQELLPQPMSAGELAGAFVKTQGPAILTGLATGNVTALASVAAGQLAGQVKSAAMGSAVGMPWHQAWEPVAVPVASLTDWPQRPQPVAVTGTAKVSGPLGAFFKKR